MVSQGTEGRWPKTPRRSTPWKRCGRCSRRQGAGGAGERRPDPRPLPAPLRPHPGRRPPILIDVLEREVGLRMATQDGGDVVMGYGLRPNPNARLYLRVVENTPEAVPFFDRDQMVRSNLRGVQIMRLLGAPASSRNGVRRRTRRTGRPSGGAGGRAADRRRGLGRARRGGRGIEPGGLISPRRAAAVVRLPGFGSLAKVRGWQRKCSSSSRTS